MTAIFNTPRPQFVDGNGNPVSGGRLYFYDAGTSTPRNVFSDEGLTTPRSQPIALDADGRAPLIFMSPVKYRVQFRTAADALIWDEDNVDPGSAVGGGVVSIANGGTGATTAAAARANLGIDAFPVGMIFHVAMRQPPAGSIKANGAAVSRTIYATLFQTICPNIGAVTITIASPGVVTLTGHGLVNGDRLRLETTAALPTGLNASTDYFVVGATANTFQLSATFGGAAINTSGTQSGTHSVRLYPYGAGDGATTFNVPDIRGEFVRGWDDGRGVDNNRPHGSAQNQDVQPHSHTATTSTDGAHSHTYFRSQATGTAVAGGPNATWSEFTTTTSSDGAHSHTVTVNNSTGIETRPRNLAMLACIKF